MKINGHDEKRIRRSLVDALTAHPQNARTHSKHQVRQIAESIRAFGFTNPILIDRRNRIIAGHGRVAAAKLLGIKEVPTIQLHQLTEEQIRAYVITDNKLAENAGWDKAILAIELEYLMTLENPDFDVTITGFEVPEIDLLLEETKQAQAADEELPEIDPSQEAVTQPGDLWRLGKHRILCGDALTESSYKVLLGDKQASAIFTDPPYNVKIDGNVSGKGQVKHADFAMASGEMSQEEFTSFLTMNLRLLAAHSVPGSLHYICMDWRHMQELLTAGKSAYTELINLCVWVKDSGGQGSFYRSQHEMILCFRHGHRRNRNNIQLGKYGRYRTNVWQYPAVRGLQHQQSDEGNLLHLHPTVKPTNLIGDAILDCTKRGEIVLDSFLGSGSTLIAAERTGRTCYSIELEPLYIDTAILRWQKHSGEQAVNALTGRTFADTQKEREASVAKKYA